MSKQKCWGKQKKVFCVDIQDTETEKHSQVRDSLSTEESGCSNLCLPRPATPACTAQVS